MSFEILWGQPNERTPIDVHEVPISIADLAAPLEGFRLAVVSDLHYGRLVDTVYARRVVETVNAQEPDAVAVLGDLIDLSRRHLERCARIAAGLRGRFGVFACMGNHEYLTDGEAAAREYRRAGLDLLVNDHRRVTIDGADLVLVGLDDLREGRPDPVAAAEGVDGRWAVIVLAHNPDHAEHLDGIGRVDLMLSGHTHGGQISPWGRPIVTQTRYRRYARGLSAGPRCPVYTTRGVGVTRLPIRICCRPEIPIIRLTAAARPAGRPLLSGRRALYHG